MGSIHSQIFKLHSQQIMKLMKLHKTHDCIYYMYMYDRANQQDLIIMPMNLKIISNRNKSKQKCLLNIGDCR